MSKPQCLPFFPHQTLKSVLAFANHVPVFDYKYLPSLNHATLSTIVDIFITFCAMSQDAQPDDVSDISEAKPFQVLKLSQQC